jgi:S-adenosyl methyltransferase
VADEEWLKETTRPVPAAHIDTSVPNVARVWNFLVGGRDNFEADRRVARQLVAIAPVMADVAPASRVFLGRVVRYLAGEAGIRQFLDIGTGIPTAGNTHEVAQAVAPESRVVYVDNDPVVLAHARALLRSAPEGVTSYIDADARDPGKIITEARDTLDFGRPVAIVMIDLLNFIAEDAEVPQILGTLLDAVPSGSYLAIMQPASDIDEMLDAARRRWNQVASTPVVLRTRTQVTSWFDGLELVEPGVVTVPEWHPAEDDPKYAYPMPLYGAAARKPLRRTLVPFPSSRA